MRKVNSHFISSGEGCNDVIGQQVTFHMTSGVWNRLEIFRYCRPEQLLLDGGWNGGAWQGDDRWRFIWMCGARFEGLPDTPFGNQLLALRKRANQLLYPARFMDTVGLTLTQAGQPVANPPRTTDSGAENAPLGGPQAKWFLLAAPARGAVMNVIQDPPKEGEAPLLTVSLSSAEFGPVKVAWALHLDGTLERLAGQQTEDRYTFSLPATEKATTVLLVNSVGPQVLRRIALCRRRGQQNERHRHHHPLRAVTLAWRLPLAGARRLDGQYGHLRRRPRRDEAIAHRAARGLRR